MSAGTKRQQIVKAFVKLLKLINGKGIYKSNLYESVEARLRFWDEVDDYPYVSVTASNETRQYMAGDTKWGYLNISIRIFVNDEYPKEELEKIFCDIECLIDGNNNLVLDGGATCTDIRLLSIIDDEGLLHPIGAGEMIYQVQYYIE